MHEVKELILSLLLLATSAVIVQAQDVQKKRRDAVLNDKKHFDIDSYWVYDDFEKARAEAQKTGKPLLVVFRCLP